MAPVSSPQASEYPPGPLQRGGESRPARLGLIFPYRLSTTDLDMIAVRKRAEKPNFW